MDQVEDLIHPAVGIETGRSAISAATVSLCTGNGPCSWNRPISGFDPQAALGAGDRNGEKFPGTDLPQGDPDRPCWVKHAVIVDVEPSTAVRQAEVTAAKTMIARTHDRFDLWPERLIADTGYGSAETLDWLVNDRGIEPHIPVFDKSKRTDDTFSRDDFVYDHASEPTAARAERPCDATAGSSLRRELA